MNVEEKISSFLREQKVVRKSELSKVKVSEEKNKNGESLFYVRATAFEEPLGSNAYTNNAVYYGFNSNGDCIGCVTANVCNVNPPSKVEIEYWASEPFKNQGNITVLAGEVIKEIFDEKRFDGLKVRNSFPPSNIETIVVSINDTNYASLAVARKLGFDEQGHLEKNVYLESKSNSTGIK